MTVEIKLYELNTSEEIPTDKTSEVIRFKKADNALVNTSDNLRKPAEGEYERSYVKVLRLKIGETGPHINIQNLKLYTSYSVLPVGMSWYIKLSDTFITPYIPESDEGGVLVTNYNTSNQLDIGSGPYTGTNTYIGKYVLLWLTLDSTVEAPLVPSDNVRFWFSYDEL